MSGDASNAHLWAEADVYVSFNLDAAIPATEDDDFDGSWELIGLLDGDAGFVQSRDEDTDDKFAWGGILMRTARNHFKQTVTFTAFEDNPTTKRLRWPHSSGGTIVVPKPERCLIGFETTDTTLGTKHRLITDNGAQAEVVLDGDVTENETDMAALPFVATIFPDSATGTLFTEQPVEDGS